MPAGTLTLYDAFMLNVGNGLIDLDTHTFRLILLTSGYTPSAAHDLLNDITGQVANANGYTTGGNALTGVTWTASGDLATFDSADTVFTASGGSIVARYGLIYDDTAAGDPLVGYFLLDSTPANVTIESGGSLTIGPNASTGWFQINSN